MIFTSMTDIATEIHAEKDSMQDSVQIEAFMQILNFNPIPCMGGGWILTPKPNIPQRPICFLNKR